LYLINLLLNSINHPSIVEFLVTILFSKKLDKNLLEQSKTVPKDPISYLKEWSFNTPWDRYENILSEKHLAYLERFERRPSSGGRKISTESMETAQANKELEESRKNLLESPETEEEFKSLTKFTGVAVDIFNEELQELTQFSCVKLIQEFQSKFVSFLWGFIWNYCNSQILDRRLKVLNCIQILFMRHSYLSLRYNSLLRGVVY